MMSQYQCVNFSQNQNNPWLFLLSLTVKESRSVSTVANVKIKILEFLRVLEPREDGVKVSGNLRFKSHDSRTLEKNYN